MLIHLEELIKRKPVPAGTYPVGTFSPKNGIVEEQYKLKLTLCHLDDICDS